MSVRRITHDPQRNPDFSGMERGVAPLFSAPLEVRRRLALPILRDLRLLVLHGAKLLDALESLPVGNAREYARWALVKALIPRLDIEAIHLWGDVALVLWLVERAIRDCTPVQRPRRGGWRVR